MAVHSLRSHLVEELADLLDAETQLTKALPKMASSASSPQLRRAFEKHLGETRNQIGRLEKALRQLGETPRRKTCEAMKGLLTEGETMMNEAPAGALRDAVMITGAQKVEHYEMATYGTVRTYAQVLGEAQVARLLAQSLKEEKAADGKLTAIAERSVNEDAAEAWQSHEWESEDASGLLDRSATWVGEALGGASRQVARGARRAATVVGLAGDRSGSRSRTRRRATGTRRASGRKSGRR